MNEFIQGLIGGFGQSGGLDKLSQWAAMKINPQGYNPFNDPLFLKEMQMASQMGGTAKNNFVDKYDDYTQFQIPEGAAGPVRMSPDQKWQQMTGLGWENPQQQVHMAQMALEQAKAKKELAQAGYWDQYAGLRGAEANQTNSLTPHLIDTEKSRASQYGSHANLYNQQALTESALREPRVYAENALGNLRGAEGMAANNRASLYNEQALTEGALRDPRVSYELARKALLDAQANKENAILPLLLEKYNADINATNALADQRKGSGSNSEDMFNQYVQYHINGGNPGTENFDLFVPPTDTEGYIVNPFSGDKWINPTTSQPQMYQTEGESDEDFNFWKWAFPVGKTGWLSQDSSTNSEGESNSMSGAKPESVGETIKQLLTRTGVKDGKELLRYLENADPEVIRVIEETSGQKVEKIIQALKSANKYVNITPGFYK